MTRPAIEITEEMIAQAEAYASRGLTTEQIALALGIGETTIYEKFKLYPNFREAINRGKSKGIAHVANALLKNVDNGNVTAQIFYLKAQAKWRDGNLIEHTGKDGEAIQIETKYKLAKSELDSRYANMALNKITEEVKDGD